MKKKNTITSLEFADLAVDLYKVRESIKTIESIDCGSNERLQTLKRISLEPLTSLEKALDKEFGEAEIFD